MLDNYQFTPPDAGRRPYILELSFLPAKKSFISPSRPTSKQHQRLVRRSSTKMPLIHFAIFTGEGWKIWMEQHLKSKTFFWTSMITLCFPKLASVQFVQLNSAKWGSLNAPVKIETGKCQILLILLVGLLHYGSAEEDTCQNRNRK